MNNKGYAMTGILYTVLIVFVLLMVSLLMNLQNRKNILQELKTEAVNAINKNTEIEYYKGQLSACQNELSTSGSANKQELVKSLQYSGLGITDETSWEEIYGILADAYPELPIGTTYDFAYTGDIQEWTVPASGLYKLEVYGAQGGNASNGGYTGGTGGHSSGYVNLQKGTILYVVVGGAGVTNGNTAGLHAGGFNGGGSGYDNGASGGGATHIAYDGRLLVDMGYQQAVTNKKLLIVAGGGGGAQSTSSGFGGSGGTGGGLSGGEGTIVKYDSGATTGKGGTQTAGGTGGGSGTFGQGSNRTSYYGPGGGGGFYGGGNGTFAGAGGGSGYIDGVPELEYKDITYSPSISNGVNSGNGKAVITYIAN